MHFSSSCRTLECKYHSAEQEHTCELELITVPSGPTQLTVQVGKDEQLNSTLSALANDSLRCDMLGTRAAYSEGGMTTPQVKESLGQVALEVI